MAANGEDKELTDALPWRHPAAVASSCLWPACGAPSSSLRTTWLPSSSLLFPFLPHRPNLHFYLLELALHRTLRHGASSFGRQPSPGSLRRLLLWPPAQPRLPASPLPSCALAPPVAGATSSHSVVSLSLYGASYPASPLQPPSAPCCSRPRRAGPCLSWLYTSGYWLPCPLLPLFWCPRFVWFD